MATQAQRLIRIQSPSNAIFTVSEQAYKHKKMAGLGNRTYQDAGYTVVSYEDGTAYEDGSEPTDLAVVNVAPEIGGDANTGHTNIDGGKLTVQQKADAGIQDKAEAPTPRARAKAADAVDPAPSQAAPPVPASN